MKSFYSWYRKHITGAIFTGLILGILTGLFLAGRFEPVLTVTSLIGSIYGGIAAYFGGIVDDIMMRIVEVLLSIPYLLIVILISVVTDSKSLGTMLIALTLTGWCESPDWCVARCFS